MPANDTLVSACIIPIGSVNIFTGFIAAALGFPEINALVPAHHPIDQEIGAQDGSDLAFSRELADHDLSNSNVQSETDTVFSQEISESDFHFVGVIEESGLQSAGFEPESIL